jgi:hypothetical protein
MKLTYRQRKALEAKQARIAAFASMIVKGRRYA